MVLFLFRLKIKSIIVVCFIILSCSFLSAANLNLEQKAVDIVPILLDSLAFNSPVILDVRSGEWTPALERELRKCLLEKQVDVREAFLGLLDNINSMLPLGMETDFGVNGDILLQMLKLPQAEILELTMEQSVETFEKRNLFSYARYKMPVNRFILKQITLPGQKLAAMKEFKLTGDPEIENPGSLLAMKWYEPILASAILGSLIYALWTLK